MRDLALDDEETFDDAQDYRLRHLRVDRDIADELPIVSERAADRLRC